MIAVITFLLASTLATGVFTVGNGAVGTPQWDQLRGTETMAANPWSGDRGDLVRLSDQEAGATDVSYRVNFTVQAGSDTIGNSLNGIYLEVTTGSPDVFSSTEQSDLVEVAVDEGSDGTVDDDITYDVDGWQVQNDGSALKIEFGGSAYTPQAGDSIVVVFEGATNPESADEYDLRAETSGDGNWHYGTITIVEEE